MFLIKKLFTYLSGLLFLALGIVLFVYYKPIDIGIVSLLKNINIKILWCAFWVASLPFVKALLSKLHILIIRFFDLIEKLLFTDALKLIFYKLKLHRRRFIRSVKFSWKSCKPTLLLLPLWICFIVVLAVFTEKTFLELLYESKFTLFSSIIIASAITVRDDYYKNKKKLYEQFEIYKDFMYALEDFINIIVKQNYPYYDDSNVHWCYTDERFKKAEGFIIYGKRTIATSLIKENLEDLKAILETIKKRITINEIITNEDMLVYFIDNALKKINSIKTSDYYDKKELSELCDDLYWFVLRSIRFPWRRDIDLDVKIHTILLNKFSAKKGDIYIDHYKRLLIDEDYCASYPKDIVKVKVKKILKYR